MKRISSVFLDFIENNHCRAYKLWQEAEVIPRLTIGAANLMA